MGGDTRTAFAFEVRLGASATLAENAAELDRLAEFTGEQAYGRAANALRQLDGGRPPIDDREAVRAALDLNRANPSISLSEACRRAADQQHPYPVKVVMRRETSRESHAARIFRKAKATAKAERRGGAD